MIINLFESSDKDFEEQQLSDRNIHNSSIDHIMPQGSILNSEFISLYERKPSELRRKSQEPAIITSLD